MEKRSHKFIFVFALAMLATLLLPQLLLADDDDPPARVARLSYAQGEVSFQPGGTDDWVAAMVNRPITTGDKLWSDRDSRAELHIGSASLRLSGNTGFSFLNLNDDVTQIQLTAGTLRIRVKRLDQNETFEVDTPNLAFSILRPGVYRISVNDEGDATAIRVRGGEGEVTGAGSAYTVHAGEFATFNGIDRLDADIERYRDYDDDFEEWCANRDRREDLSVSSRYVSTDVIGYEDLDEYGGWRPVPEYGTVWFPHTTIIGWAPYRYGHWAYVYPWGYTWIDDAPWGFAPFHYGRWVFVGGAWGWVPCPPRVVGVAYVRPVYAPALVAWVGGPHFAVGFSTGGFAGGVRVGWFPLGPREVYVPSYPVSRTYITNVNISNTTVNTTVVNNYYTNVVVNKNVTVQQVYVNQRITGAVTATTPQAFTSAQPVARNVVQVNQREVVSAPVNVVAPAAAPGKQAVLGTGAVTNVKPPAFVQNRAVVAKVTPPPPPVPFVRQQQAIQANGGRPLAISQEHQLQQDDRGVRTNVRIANQTAITNQGNTDSKNTGRGNNSVQTTGGNNNQQGGGNNNGNQNGYRRFNDRPQSSQPVANTAVTNNNGARGGNNSGSVSSTTTAGNNTNGINTSATGGSNSANGGNNGSNGTNGNNANQSNYRKFNDRPPSSQPGGNTAVTNNNGTRGGNNSAVNSTTASGNINSGGNNSNYGSNNSHGNNSGLDTRHQQELQDLHQRHDQERQKLEQQQTRENKQLSQKNNNNQVSQQQLNQKHQQQLEELEKKHDNERQKLQDKQQQERKKTSN